MVFRKGLRLAEGFQTWTPEVGEDGVFKVQSSTLQGTRLVVLPSAYYETKMEGAAEVSYSWLQMQIWRHSDPSVFI